MLNPIEVELTISGFPEQIAAFVETVESAREGHLIRFNEPPWASANSTQTAPGPGDSLAAHAQATRQWSTSLAHVIEGPTRGQGGRKKTYALTVIEVPLSAIEHAARQHKWLTFQATYALAGQEFEAMFSRGGWQLRKAPDEYLSVEKVADPG